MPNSATSATVVIPARFGSSRFPGKPLVPIAGKPLIQHVYERVRGCFGVERVIVATDDSRIADVVQRFGGDCMLMTENYRTGTDRVAGVARQTPGSVFVNLQGDEVILDQEMLTDLISQFVASGTEIGTLKRALTSEAEIRNPSVVKVVTDRSGRALYFSRATIPHIRDLGVDDSLVGPYFVHLGIYIYTRAALERFAALPTGMMEELEKLEQLRALEHGLSIRVWETRHRSLRIDTPEDVEEAARSLSVACLADKA